MKFTSAITNQATTANGAVSNKSSLSACLDLFSMGVSADYNTKKQLITAAIAEDLPLAVKVIFYLRDCRGGQGNKDILQAALTTLPTKTVVKLLPFIPEFGSFKDLCKLHKQFGALIVTPIAELFATELRNGNKLAGKWAPRKGELAKAITRTLDLTPKSYRKLIVSLSDTVEQRMCAGKWSEINYNHVPSVANKLYHKAFWRQDKDRYNAFVHLVNTGETTMHSSLLYPHDIVNMITNGNPYNSSYYNGNKQTCSTADALWKSLPDFMSSAHNVLPIIDMSGSMTSKVYSNISCMDIAVGLGMYFAEHNTGTYKDLWCHFSLEPKAQFLKGDTLYERLRNMDKSGMMYDTNLEAVFDLILSLAKTSDDVPETVLIISDMEFNNTSVSVRTNFATIKNKFEQAGVKLPLLVFWRVDVKNIQQPVTLHDGNTVLLNGYSPAVCKSIFTLNRDTIDPYNMMIHTLGTKYDEIAKKIMV